MASKKQPIHTFVVRDCALAAIATGRRAQNLRELRNQLATVHPDSIYYHFWGGLLRPRFDDPEYNNDFSAWARHGLHDPSLAERLGIIDPTDFDTLEALRSELIEVIEERLDETEYVPWARSDEEFHFIRSQIVVFNTGRQLEHPRDLPGTVAGMSLGSIFFHVIDARRRTWNRVDDFRSWLLDLGPAYESLCRDLADVDPYFIGLDRLRREITAIFQAHLGGGESR